MSDEAREAAWDALAGQYDGFPPEPDHAFNAGFNAGITEGIRQARAAVVAHQQGPVVSEAVHYYPSDPLDAIDALEDA